nr:hypothetical protein [Tanacetum cinerariifolium]
MLPVTQIDTFYNGLTLRHLDTINAAAGGTFMKRRLEECYDLIKNMTAHHNDWDTSAQQTTVGQTQSVYAAGAYQGSNSYQPQGEQPRKKPIFQGASHGPNSPSAYQALAYQVPGYQALVHQPLIPQLQMNTASSSGSRTLPSDTVTNPEEDLKGITTRSGNAYQGPTIPTTSSSLPKVVERKTDVTKDTPVVAPIAEPVVAPVSAPKPNQKPSIPYPSRLHEQKLRDKANDQKENFFQIFKDLDFNVSFADALILMPKFRPTIKMIFFSRKSMLSSLLKDDPTSPGVDHSYYDTKEDILLLEAFLNNDPSFPPPNQGMYLPQVRKELKICEAKNDKSSIDEPPEVELKDLPPHLEYIFLEGDDKLPVIIAKDLSVEKKAALIKVLKSHKQAIAWKLSDIKGINPKFCTHEILMEDDFEPAVQHQRRVNLKVYEVIKKEVLKLLDAGSIYPISDSPWVSPVHCVPKKGDFTVVENEENELIPTRLVTGWRVCIDYHQEKTTFMCPYGRLPTVACRLGYAMHRARSKEKMLKRCEDTNLCLNWEKSHFMVKEGIVLGHKISKNEIDLDKAKVDVIAKLPHPTTVKGVRSFLGHDGFYRRFIQDFSKIARPMTHLLEKDTSKPLTFSRLATMDPLGDIMARTTPLKRCLTLDFIGPQSIVMPMTWSNLVTLVSVKERFCNEMKCLKIPSKFVKFLTFGASISWGLSRVHEGTSLELPMPSLVIVVRTSAITSSQRSCLSMVSLTVLLPHTTLKLVGNGYRQKDKIKANSDKTEHEMKSMKKSKVNKKSTQSKSKTEPSANFLAVASHFFWQWHQSSLAVRTSTACGNSNLAMRMPCAFYSQQSSPKLDAPFAFKFSRIK